MDSLDHCFCMFQVETKMENETVETIQASPKTDTTESHTDTTDTRTGGRGGSAVRRVDLIVTPPKQFPFALLGWTGSKVKNIIYSYVETVIHKNDLDNHPFVTKGKLGLKETLTSTASMSKCSASKTCLSSQFYPIQCQGDK